MVIQIYNNNIMGWGSFELLSIVFSALNILDVGIEIYF
jgi:hypothetical protein